MPGFDMGKHNEARYIDRKKYRDALNKKGSSDVSGQATATKNKANKIGLALIVDPTLNPANLLQAAGSNPVKRGREKVNHTLLWLAIFVRSTQAVILQRLGIQARGWMRKLEKDGYVKPVLSNINSGELWVLTQEGIQAAQGVWSKEFKHYPDRPERMSQANLRHDLAVQKIVAELMEKGEASAFMPGSAIGGNSNEWRPDAIVQHRDGHWVGIEYERNPKYGEERLVKLNRIIKYLNDKNQDEFTFSVRWFSHHKECLADYKSAMQKGMEFREYVDWAKQWKPDPNEPGKIRRLLNLKAFESVHLDRDLAKYM